jgi:DNA polymerase-4
MDAFYASVEQREQPELRGKPVIVGAHSARGVVAAASYEARAFGVRSAMPGFRARALCPEGVFLPGRMSLYAEVSADVHEVFREFTPEIQPLSLDEAFLDVGGSMHFFDGPEDLGRELKAKVKARTGLNVSVGVASSKLVAKIACTLSKPNGLLVVRHGTERELLAPLPVRALWGVGPVLGAKLQTWGIRTIGELAAYEPRALVSLAGERAFTLGAWARGEDTNAVESSRVPKSCGEENTFATDVVAREEVSAALTAHSEAVAGRLRNAQLCGRTVTLKVKLGRRQGRREARLEASPSEPVYPLLSRSHSLDVPTNDGRLIREIALQLWDQLAVAVPVRLLGVSLSNLQSAAAAVQLDLFGERQRADRLGPTLDEIQQRFGKGAIRRAVDAPEKTTLSLHRK